MLGTYALSAGYYDAYYLKAQKGRTLIKRDFDLAFAEVDVIVTPTAPRTAFRLGEKVDDPLQMYLEDIFTLPINLAGICGISLPCGYDAESLPIGLQILRPPSARRKRCASRTPTSKAPIGTRARPPTSKTRRCSQTIKTRSFS